MVAPRRRWQLGVSTALWLLTCAAMFFGGYRIGGWSGEVPPDAVIVKSYSVADLVASQTDGEPGPLVMPDLVEAVATSIGGDAGVEVRGYEKNNSLLVMATPDDHQQIERVIAALRGLLEAHLPGTSP